MDEFLAFDYHRALSRNIGWLTEAEQARMRHAGAFMPFMGQPVIDTLARLAHDINPETDLRLSRRVSPRTTWMIC